MSADDDDPLRPARGIGLGAIIGALVWLLFILVWHVAHAVDYQVDKPLIGCGNTVTGCGGYTTTISRPKCPDGYSLLTDEVHIYCAPNDKLMEPTR
jgi:hypothetical protein